MASSGKEETVGSDEEESEWAEGEEVIDEGEFEAEGWEEIPDDPEEASKLLEALEGIVPDILKRTIEAGVGGISTSEERIRKALADKKLPKEVVAYILKQADTTKREFFRVLSREIREVLEEMDLGGELAEILTTLSLEARIQVRFVENEESVSSEGVKPKTSGKFRVTQSKKEAGTKSPAREGGEREEGSSGGDGSNDEDDDEASDEA